MILYHGWTLYASAGKQRRDEHDGARPTAIRKISLVLADVDGSLLTSEKVLTERAANAVKALGAAGIAFAITSGRPPRGMAMLVAPLALKTPIAGFNGGVLFGRTCR